MIRMILIILYFSFLPSIHASDESFDLALQNAERRIEAFEQALQTGNSKQIRETALELQKDPLAIRRVNENRPDSFKIELNQELNNIQVETKARVRKQIAEKYQVPESDVTFFEATNPSAEVKVGQDWDVTVQVQGKDVPLEVSTQIVHDAYAQVATGRSDISGKEATHFAHQQAVEVTNRTHAEAYGGGGRREIANPDTGEIQVMTEGGEIIVGDKGQPMRDAEQLTNVMQHKSELAKNQAQDIRDAAEKKIKDEGLKGQEAESVRRQADADAQAWEMEQARQHTKQQARQMEPRVEAMGGNVPEQVHRGNEILDQVAKGQIPPAEGRRQLADMGETPESIIEKGAGLHEAAQKLKSPEEKIRQAQALKESGRDDVLIDNVKERMEIKDLERRAELKKQGLTDAEIDAKLSRQKSGSLEEVRARAKSAGIDAPDNHLLDGGKASVKKKMTSIEKVGMGVEVMQAAGEVSESYLTEAQAAAKEGRETSAMNVATETGRKVLGGSEYDMGHQISSDAIREADQKGESRWSALWNSVTENLRQRFGGGTYDMSQKINEEEAQKELELAEKEGREASSLNAKTNAAVRVAGEMTGMRSVADAVYYDQEVDRQMHETQKQVQAKAKEKLEAGMHQLRDTEESIYGSIANWNDLEQRQLFRRQLDDKMVQHLRQKKDLLETLESLESGGVIDTSDPEYIAIVESVKLATSIDSTHFEEKISEKRKELKRMSKDDIMKDFQCPDPKMIPKWSDMSLSAYCDCPKFYKLNEGMTECVLNLDKIANQDCSHFPNAVPVWDEEENRVTCNCVGDYEPSSARTHCRIKKEIQVLKANCDAYPGMVPEWDNATEEVVCQCVSGYWSDSKGYCVVSQAREDAIMAELRGDDYTYEEPSYVPPPTRNRRQEMQPLINNMLGQLGNAYKQQDAGYTSDSSSSYSGNSYGAVGGGEGPCAPTSSSATGYQRGMSSCMEYLEQKKRAECGHLPYTHGKRTFCEIEVRKRILGE